MNSSTNLETALACPRKAFLSDMKTGAKKYSQLRKIMKEAVMTSFPFTPKAEVEATVSSLFGMEATAMLPFEAEGEQKRMAFLINRYNEWEATKGFGNWIVVALDKQVEIDFAGMKRIVQVHRLFHRGNGYYETVRYSYSTPKTSARSKINGHNTSVDLLLLQLAGEKILADMGVQNGIVSGAIYSLKGRDDTAANPALLFEGREGANIASYHFSTQEYKNMENTYTNVGPDAAKEACDPKTCRDCLYADLCHMEFKKRKLTQTAPKKVEPINSFHLTESQRELVEFEHGICRVDAVAGSGKTTVVTLRTLRLLEEGVNPEEILMITFTDKAAREMRDRLKAYESGAALNLMQLHADKVKVATFNSWGNDLLGEYYKDLGFSQQPKLIDDVTKKDIILELLDKHRNLPLDYNNPFMNTFSASGCVVAMTQVLDALKAAHVENEAAVAAIVGERFRGKEKELLEIYNAYNAKQISMNLIDYEDQLRLILNLEPLGIFSKLKYRHVVIDEFQDSNPNQISLISKIVAQDRYIESLIVVGDNMQAIYGFRNATPENIVSFDQIFPGCIDIHLEDNFRSQTPIISVANNILRRESAMKKAMIAHRKENGIAPAKIEMPDQSDEIALFVKQTKKLIRDGHNPDSIAVLCRTKGELVKIQEAMSAKGIPTMLRVPEITGEAPYVKSVIALAAFFADNDNMLDLALYAKSLGQDPYDVKLLEDSKTALLDGLAQMKTEADKIEFFFGLCSEARDDYVAADFIAELRSKEFKTLHALTSYCVKYRYYDVKDPHATKLEEANAVNLITVHSAKGLEWATVLLSLRKFHTDEEERRLLYVAVTRAKERLLITYTDKQHSLMELLRD